MQLHNFLLVSKLLKSIFPFIYSDDQFNLASFAMLYIINAHAYMTEWLLHLYIQTLAFFKLLASDMKEKKVQKSPYEYLIGSVNCFLMRSTVEIQVILKLSSF